MAEGYIKHGDGIFPRQLLVLLYKYTMTELMNTHLTLQIKHSNTVNTVASF